ncbi:MAG: hypothetical protein Kow001_06940 [Acidobacteriota bacterium]
MCSQHWVFFAGLRNRQISRILEIGTYRAQFTRVLAALYPDAEIVTCDLPEESPTFRASYGRSAAVQREAFLHQRDQCLAELKNVTFVAANSFLLPERVSVQFDLVWVDGGHSYPDVAWDACNAWHLASPSGYILFGDIYLHPRARNYRLIPDLNDSGHLLKALEREGLVTVSYIHKRLIRRASCDPLLRKHIAVVRKPSGPSMRAIHSR